MAVKDITVPDIGDFSDIPVIEVLVSEGDQVEAERSLLTLESDKATMEVPSPQAGTIRKILVKEGDTVNKGDVIGQIEAEDGASASQTDPSSDDQSSEKQESESTTEAQADTRSDADEHFDVVVLGAGPGGYTAAFRAADLGLKVALIERYPVLGGVCLNVGCIPSKALLHTAQVMDEIADMSAHGVTYDEPKLDLDKLRSFKQKTVDQLTGGLSGMAKKRKVTTIEGSGNFLDAHTITVGDQKIGFDKAIIAVGSQAIKLPGFPWDDERVMDSTDALELAEIPKKLLVVGGGIIGLEMACVYAGLGSEVTVVELSDQLIPGADADLVRPLAQRLKKRYAGIHLKAKIEEVKAQKNGMLASFGGENAPDNAIFDRVLVAVGRSPNGGKIDAEKAGVQVSDRGFIEVDNQMRTNVDHIFAIGDVVGQPMLAHKATYEAKVAAEVCAGEKSANDARCIPSVAYTDPEVAWVGLTENQANEDGVEYEVGKFPWAASGRAIGIARTEGFTKLLFDAKSHRIIGAGIVGPHAGDLIAELGLAIEMGCDAADIGLTIHPHPTLAESVMMAAEVFEGTITDLYMPKRK